VPTRHPTGDKREHRPPWRRGNCGAAAILNSIYCRLYSPHYFAPTLTLTKNVCTDVLCRIGLKWGGRRGLPGGRGAPCTLTRAWVAAAGAPDPAPWRPGEQLRIVWPAVDQVSGPWPCVRCGPVPTPSPAAHGPLLARCSLLLAVRAAPCWRQGGSRAASVAGRGPGRRRMGWEQQWRWCACGR
jgi:hypothetical protein